MRHVNLVDIVHYPVVNNKKFAILRKESVRTKFRVPPDREASTCLLNPLSVKDRLSRLSRAAGWCLVRVFVATALLAALLRSVMQRVRRGIH